MASCAPQFDIGGSGSPRCNPVETDDDSSSQEGGSVSTTEEGSLQGSTPLGTADSSSSSSDSSDGSTKEKKRKSKSISFFT